MIFQDMDRIVFAGDSVTDMGSQNPVGEGLFDSIGHSYVRVIENLLAALYPEVHLRVTNSGISGDNSQMLLARWERDVRALVELLPSEQREVVIMRYFSGLSFKEIAEQTDVSINTALGRMRYALINLRRMIKEKNLILS